MPDWNILNKSLQWRHNGCDSVSNHQPHDCFLNRLFRRRSKKTSKLRVTGLCEGNSPGTGEFLTQMASYAEIFFVWWRHHVECHDVDITFLSCILRCWWLRSLIKSKSQVKYLVVTDSRWTIDINSSWWVHAMKPKKSVNCLGLRKWQKCL